MLDDLGIFYSTIKHQTSGLCLQAKYIRVQAVSTSQVDDHVLWTRSWDGYLENKGTGKFLCSDGTLYRCAQIVLVIGNIDGS